MRVLIVGGGGREHALAWRWLTDSPDDTLLVAPGNGGTASIATNLPLDVSDAAAVARCALQSQCDLVVIGPDAAAAAGVADACIAADIAVFGPTASAARIESSKTFAKQLMRRAGIGTADWVSGSAAQRTSLEGFIRDHEGRCVVKADGLALGKGVAVCDTMDDALLAMSRCFDERRFGDAGATIVIEERLEGAELSVFGISDGTRVCVLPSARDHKRAFDGDTGPNTGGMGAVSPAEAGTDAAELAGRTVLQPCVDALRDAGSPFVGCLYAGLMLTAAGPRVLEFNARFGDPETQAMLPMLAESLPALLLGAAHGNGEDRAASVRSGACVAVVAAAQGYPGSVRTGDEITGLDALDDSVLCFHAGTARDAGGRLRTAGGRVLSVAARGDSLDDAIRFTYANLGRVQFDGIWYRRDIGVPGGVVVSA